MLRARYLLLLTLTLGLIGGVRLHAEADKADATSIEKLVKQLGSDSFSDREEAATKLEKIGAAALESLKKAAKSEDVETRRRAEELVGKIESKAQTERLLAPTRVKLAYKDAPVPEAVVDFARRSGRPVVLAADQVQKLAGRKVTVESSELTFWEALDLFCRKADLTESFSVNVPVNPPRAGAVRPGVVVARPIGRLNATNEIVLTDGKPSDRPVSYTGAARVRVLPGDAPVLAAPRQPGENLVGLGVALEGVGTLQGVTSVKVDKAVDDQNQALALAEAAPAPGGNPGGGVILWNVKGRLVGGLPTSYDYQTSVRLKAGEKAAKSLKELSGVVVAEVQLGDAVLTVNDVLKAAGQPAVKGTDGEALRVVEIVKQDDGQYKVTVELTLPNQVAGQGVPPPVGGIALPPINIRLVPGPLPAPAPAPVPAPQPEKKEGAGFQVQIQIAPPPAAGAVPAIGRIVVPGNRTDALNLTLLDDKGQKYTQTGILASRVKSVDKTTSVHEATLLFKAEREQVAPAKLVYSTFKTVALEIPFKLKDVNLP